jgi:fructose/tagatose bisphosphate aldolase
MKKELKVVYDLVGGVNDAMEHDLVAVAQKHGYGLMSFGTNNMAANQRDLNFFQGNEDPVMLKSKAPEAPKAKEAKEAAPKAKAKAKKVK